MAEGARPTWTAGPARPLASKIGVTVRPSEFVTKAAVPSGVIAIASGPCPTLIGRPAVSVATWIGVTAADP